MINNSEEETKRNEDLAKDYPRLAGEGYCFFCEKERGYVHYFKHLRIHFLQHGLMSSFAITNSAIFEKELAKHAAPSTDLNVSNQMWFKLYSNATAEERKFVEEEAWPGNFVLQNLEEIKGSKDYQWVFLKSATENILGFMVFSANHNQKIVYKVAYLFVKLKYRNQKLGNVLMSR